MSKLTSAMRLLLQNPHKLMREWSTFNNLTEKVIFFKNIYTFKLFVGNEGSFIIYLCIASCLVLWSVAQPTILFGRGQSMTSSVTDVILSQTVPSVYFITVEIDIKHASRTTATWTTCFREAWPLRPHSDCDTGYDVRAKIYSGKCDPTSAVYTLQSLLAGRCLISAPKQDI